MFTLLVILAAIYVFLKVSNTRAEFARRDAEREREEQAAMEAMEEAAEEEEMRCSAIDVEAETIINEEADDAVFEVEPAAYDEEPAAVNAAEYDTVH